MLTRRCEASGGNVQIRERLEDVQLRRARQQLDMAEKKAKAERTEAAVKLYHDLKADLLNKEIQVYTARCERYPANLGFKVELATAVGKGQEVRRGHQAFPGGPHRSEAQGAGVHGPGPLLHAHQAIQDWR